MIDSSSFYASSPVRDLFAQELAALAPILAGVYGNFGLFLRAHAGAPATLPKHLLGTVIDLALGDAQHFNGRLSCSVDELPLASESCKLVVAQHVFERLAEPEQCASELARVLAPEGVALILGFNPLTLWRPWLAGKARQSGVSLHVQSALSAQQAFTRHGIEILQTRYFGTALPRARALEPDQAQNAWRSPTFGRIAASWLLLARKRHSVLTPLRSRKSARELALNPRLAPGAHRECA